MFEPPLVSVPKGTNIAPTPIGFIPGVLIAIMISKEYNSSKGKHQYRRWLLVEFDGSDCFVPLEKVSLVDGEYSMAAAPISEKIVYSATLSALTAWKAAAARKPATLHSANGAAVFKVGNAAPRPRQEAIN
eukprot:1924245-Pleurochrysis_carterae.AAC.1